MIKPGMFIGDRYEIIDKVGSGGMADVYKARCHRLNRFVAIKVLKSEYSSDTNFVAKFRAEAQSVAGLSHPNIVNVYDVGEDNGLYYIVMELVEGITLKSFIERKGKLEVKEAVGIAIQISQGMEAAHDNHIIHRDIKPQNIIISREGKVKVTDFGIAKAASSNTITSNTMGSVHYISPEQARGGYSDEKSDIYSLGVTLFEMLSGKVPYEGDNTVSVALLHIQGEAPALRDLEPSIPVSLDRIVQKCMQKKPERRYLYTSELIADLKRSIMNPDGNFVKITPEVMDSKTIIMSEEDMNHIKNATKKIPITNQQTTNPRKSEKEDELLEEDDADVDPRIEKISVIGGIVAAIILVIIIIVFIANAVGLVSFGGKKQVDATPSPTISVSPSVSPTATESAVGSVTVPDVKGETLENAQKILEDDLKLTVSFNYEPSDVIEKDYVISQSIEEDEVVEEGDIITLIVSSGPEETKVPDVYNKSSDAAEKTLSDNGFDIKHQYTFSDTVKSGYVISTNPAKGKSVSKGATITIVLSKGKETTMVGVPDLSGLTETEAIEELADLGLQKGTVTYEYSPDIPKGKVMSQDYTPEKQVEEGTKVGFAISRGPETINYSYRGTVTINNPFTAEGESGIVKLSLTLNGKTDIVHEQSYSYSDFPLNNLSITGWSEGSGTIKVYVNDVLQNTGSYPITIKKYQETE